MLVVISPAKKLDMQRFEDIPSTQPLFEHEVRELVETMRNLSPIELRSLMGISENLAKLNADRFARFGSQDKNPAVFTFAGDTYFGVRCRNSRARVNGLGAKSFASFVWFYMGC